MITQSSPALAPDASRQAVRLTGDFVLSKIRMVTDALQVDLISALVFLAITRANVRSITDDPGQAQRFSALGQIPPDAERASISVYALAREMNLPYETTRRHVAKLAERGLCQRLDTGGLIVPTRVFATAEATQATQRSWASAVAFVAGMARSGVRALPGDQRNGDVRTQVARLNTDHFLNCLAILNQAFDFDLVNGLVFMAIVRANTWGITSDPVLSVTYGGMDTVPPDELRTPVSVYALARQLKLPYETTRRYVLSLVEKGLCERVAEGGMIVPGRVHLREDMKANTLANWRETQRYLTALAAVGLVAEAA